MQPCLFEPGRDSHFCPGGIRIRKYRCRLNHYCVPYQMRVYNLRMHPRRSQPTDGRWLDVDEVRLVADLRLMHAQVDQLHSFVANLQQRHDEADICKYADGPVLDDDIRKADEIYLWFLKVKQERERSLKRA